MICKECEDIFIVYFCFKCKKGVVDICRECHDELEHGIIAYNTGKPVHGGSFKNSPYCDEDAQYFPGICDKFRPV